MFTDIYGQKVFTEEDLCNLYLSDPTINLDGALVDKPIHFDPSLELNKIPSLIKYHTSELSIQEFDEKMSNNWHMPEEYKNFDIASFILDQCKNDAELQRAGEELLLFQERDMFILLKYLKYLVDLMREHNVVWGVGRGSSVSSFVLYLIGIHKINSLYYDLSIEEFIK